MKDLSFLIPIRLDTIQRLENLLVVVQFLRSHFDSPILIYEASSYSTGMVSPLIGKEAAYTFEEDGDTIFHRTKYINKLVKLSSTSLVAVWDCDVIIPPNQLKEAVQVLKEGRSSFVFPYEKEFLDTGVILREIFIKERKIEILLSQKGKMTTLYAPDPIGGAFLANRKDYIAIGMENPNFYGWGREDGERLHRWKGMGYKHSRIEGPLFHLSHPRGMNSSFHNDREDQGKWNDILRIKSLGKKELIKEIQRWDLS
jgi:predicted glycosyltransferase involved in capsule biosynthesis